MENKELIKEALSYSLASDLHEIWRESRKKEDGSINPKNKRSKDEEWNITHGTNDVDTASLPFDKLPSNCQTEELEDPKNIIDIVYDKVMEIDEFKQYNVDEMASDAHEEWKKRNEWEIAAPYGDTSLNTTFDKLEKRKKDEYRLGIKMGIKKVEDYKKGNINIEEICNQYELAKQTRSR